MVKAWTDYTRFLVILALFALIAQLAGATKDDDDATYAEYTREGEILAKAAVGFHGHRFPACQLFLWGKLDSIELHWWCSEHTEHRTLLLTLMLLHKNTDQIDGYIEKELKPKCERFREQEAKVRLTELEKAIGQMSQVCHEILKGIPANKDFGFFQRRLDYYKDKRVFKSSNGNYFVGTVIEGN